MSNASSFVHVDQVLLGAGVRCSISFTAAAYPGLDLAIAIAGYVQIVQLPAAPGIPHQQVHQLVPAFAVHHLA